MDIAQEIVENLEVILNQDFACFSSPSESFPGWFSHLDLYGGGQPRVYTTSWVEDGEPVFIKRTEDSGGHRGFSGIKKVVGQDISELKVLLTGFRCLQDKYVDEAQAADEKAEKTLKEFEDQDRSIIDMVCFEKNNISMEKANFDIYVILVHPFYMALFNSLAVGHTKKVVERSMKKYHTALSEFLNNKNVGLVVYEEPNMYMAFTEKIHEPGIVDAVFFTDKYGQTVTYEDREFYARKRLVFGGGVVDECLYNNLYNHNGLQGKAIISRQKHWPDMKDYGPFEIMIAPELTFTGDGNPDYFGSQNKVGCYTDEFLSQFPLIGMKELVSYTKNLGANPD